MNNSLCPPTSFPISRVVFLTHAASMNKPSATINNTGFLLPAVAYRAVGISPSMKRRIIKIHLALSSQAKRVGAFLVHKLAQFKRIVSDSTDTILVALSIRARKEPLATQNLGLYKRSMKLVNEVFGGRTQAYSQLIESPLGPLDTNAPVSITVASHEVGQVFWRNRRHLQSKRLTRRNAKLFEPVRHLVTEYSHDMKLTVGVPLHWTCISNGLLKLVSKFDVGAYKGDVGQGVSDITISSKQSQDPGHFSGPSIEELLIDGICPPAARFNRSQVCFFGISKLHPSLSKNISKRTLRYFKASCNAAQALFVSVIAALKRIFGDFVVRTNPGHIIPPGGIIPCL